MTFELVVHADRATLASETATRLADAVAEVLADRPVCHLALTGGTVGVAVLAACHTVDIDWTRVHCWWGDERFVPAVDGDRNAVQARDALLDHIAIPAENIHELPASDASLDLDAAAVAATDELGDVDFDITFLGVGPDAHVASLFPGHAGARATERGVIAVRQSPKPPPERLSMTRATLNRSRRVWFVLVGDDKASALALALSGADPVEVPAAGVRGVNETLYLVDRAAASLLPDSLTS